MTKAEMRELQALRDRLLAAWQALDDVLIRSADNPHPVAVVMHAQAAEAQRHVDAAIKNANWKIAEFVELA